MLPSPSMAFPFGARFALLAAALPSASAVRDSFDADSLLMESHDDLENVSQSQRSQRDHEGLQAPATCVDLQPKHMCDAKADDSLSKTIVGFSGLETSAPFDSEDQKLEWCKTWCEQVAGAVCCSMVKSGSRYWCHAHTKAKFKKVKGKAEGSWAGECEDFQEPVASIDQPPHPGVLPQLQPLPAADTNAQAVAQVTTTDTGSDQATAVTVAVPLAAKTVETTKCADFGAKQYECPRHRRTSTILREGTNKAKCRKQCQIHGAACCEWHAKPGKCYGCTYFSGYTAKGQLELSSVVTYGYLRGLEIRAALCHKKGVPSLLQVDDGSEDVSERSEQHSLLEARSGVATIINATIAEVLEEDVADPSEWHGTVEADSGLAAVSHHSSIAKVTLDSRGRQRIQSEENM